MARYEEAFPAVCRKDGSQLGVGIPAQTRRRMHLRPGSRVYVYLAKEEPMRGGII